MARRINKASRSEDGFTLIEILVVVLIIGILAAIAIPTFISQKSKATDASAKELARNAQIASETYATDHNGNYTGLSVAELVSVEKSIKNCAGKKASELNEACLSAASSAEASKYEVTAESTGGHTFTVKHSEAGNERTCTPAGKTGAEGGGCQNSKW